MPSALHGAVPTPSLISTSLKRPLQDTPLPIAKRQIVSSSSTQPYVSTHFTKTTTTQKFVFDLQVVKVVSVFVLHLRLLSIPSGQRCVPYFDQATLDKVYDELRGDVKEAVSGKTATFVVDGWSNIHN